jgi:hypothetical protein
LADGEVEIADLFGDQQHALDYGRQIEETHLVCNPGKKLMERVGREGSHVGRLVGGSNSRAQHCQTQAKCVDLRRLDPLYKVVLSASEPTSR